MEFLCNNKLCTMSTFFKNDTHATFKSFNRDGTMHQIDHILGCDGLKKITSHCGVDNRCNPVSGHNTLVLTLNIRAERRKVKPKIHVNWLKLIDPLARVAFNDKLEKILSNCVDLRHDEYCKDIVKAVSKAVKDSKVDKKGWLELSKDMLRPIIEERKRLLTKVKASEGKCKKLRRLCHDAKNTVRDTVKVVKETWIKVQVDKIKRVKIHLKEV